MHLRVTVDGRHVELRIKGHSLDTLRAAAETAHQLLRVQPAEETDDEQPFGFTLSADTERSERPPEDEL